MNAKPLIEVSDTHYVVSGCVVLSDIAKRQEDTLNLSSGHHELIVLGDGRLHWIA
jgi:hypothetical protein